MAKKIRRRNEPVLRNIRAAIMGIATAAGLWSVGLRPILLAVVVGIIVGVVATKALEAAAMIAVAAMSVPLIHANPVLGIAFLFMGVAAIHYLGANGGQPFLVIALAIAGAGGPTWAAAVVAGYALGLSHGAIIAAVGCVFVEVLGLAVGKPFLGALVVGGSKSHALLSITQANVSVFTVAWAKGLIGNLNMESLTDLGAMFTGANYPVLLIGQPVLWAGAAALSATMGRQARRRNSIVLSVVAAAVVTIALAFATVMLNSVAGVGRGPGAGSIAFALVASLVTACGFAFVWDRYFRLERIAMKSKGSAFSMAAEDADVDELLSLISTAEEKLANDHAATRIVMITDMKSFSRMTEEDGSMMTAKAIQRHRDLLLPVVSDHGGHGKSTGGDGLLAAFPHPKDAISAAVDMQQTLDAYTKAHPKEREMTIRIGIAEGEVMLDKGGRPFIGAALNLAARIMNLADGGQIFVASETAGQAGGIFQLHSHGPFELKNIAKPIDVSEVLWGEGQRPVDPRTREADEAAAAAEMGATE